MEPKEGRSSINYEDIINAYLWEELATQRGMAESFVSRRFLRRRSLATKPFQRERERERRLN